MKSIGKLIVVGLLATSLVPFNAIGASLLGGLITTGSDSGNSNSIISIESNNSGTSIGLLGSEGAAVNLPTGDSGGSVPVVGEILGGNSDGSLPVVGELLGGDGGGSLPIVGDILGSGGVTLPVDLDDIDLDIGGVLGVNTTPATGGGTTIGVDVLGGNGGTIGVNPLDLLNSNGGVDVNLPDLGCLLGCNDNGGGGNGGNGNNGGNGGTGGTGGTGGNGANGNNGTGGNGNGGNNGGNGGNGSNGGGNNGGGSNGGPIIKYYSNGSGSSGSFAIPSGISSKLKALLRILAERDYLRVSNGRAVCLNSFGIAEVAGWVPKKDWGALQQALGSYSQDIYTLRQLLANCSNRTQRQALNLTDLNRVIAIDIDKNGQPVLFML